MQLLRITVRHTCPFSTPVRSRRSARVTHLCHRGNEAMLELHDPNPEDLASLVTEYDRIGGKMILLAEGGKAALVRFPSCACCREGRVIPTIEAAGHHYLPPSAYTGDGDEVYQFLARQSIIDSDLLRQLPSGVEIVRTGVRPLTDLEFEGGFLVPVGTLFKELTARQRSALVTAVQRGYYRIPRPVTTTELAGSLGISREAFEALLRKGENKMMAALFPYLVLGAPPERIALLPDS